MTSRSLRNIILVKIDNFYDSSTVVPVGIKFQDSGLYSGEKTAVPNPVPQTAFGAVKVDFVAGAYQILGTVMESLSLHTLLEG
jgi:hypothetical protein